MFARLASLYLLGALLIPGSGRADLHCAQPIFLAGTCRSGPTIEHAFHVVNTGKEPIQVSELKTGCGCLQARIDRTVLPAGERATVSLVVNTVTQAEGPNAWRVTVFHPQGEVPLEIRATLIRDVSIQPAALVATTTKPVTHQFKLTDRRKTPIEVLGASCSYEHFQATVSKPTPTSEGFERTLTLSILPTCPAGRWSGVICILTDDVSCRELKVPFTIIHQPRGHVCATPSAIELQGERAFPARIVLLTGTEVVRVDRVEAEHNAVRCTFAAGPGDRSTLRIVVDADKLPSGAFQSKVKVHLRQPPGEALEIPIRVSR